MNFVEILTFRRVEPADALKIPLSNKNLDKFREENKKEIKELMVEVFRTEVNALVEPLIYTIQKSTADIEDVKAAAAQTKTETELMIVTEPLKQKEKEGQLFITGIKSKDEVTELLKNILNGEPDVKFYVLLETRKKNKAVASEDAAPQTKNCLIGLQGVPIFGEKANSKAKIPKMLRSGRKGPSLDENPKNTPFEYVCD